MQKFLPVFEKILFSFLLFTVIFIPLVPKIPLLPVTGSFVAIRIEDFVTALLFLLWGLYILLSGKLKMLLSDSLNQAILLFFFVGGVSAFAAIFLTHTVSTHLAALHFLRRVELITILPVVTTLVHSKKQVTKILTALGGVTLITVFYGLGQKYLHFPIIATTTSELSKGEITYMNEWTRINSTFAGHYDFAIFLVMVITMMAAMFFYYKKLLVRGGMVVLAAFSFVALMLTAARLSFVAVVVGAALSLILVGKKNYLIVMFIVALVALAYPSQLRDRFVSTITVNLMHSGSRYTAETSQQNARSQLNIPTLPGNIVRVSDDATQSASYSAQYAPDIVPGEPTDTTELGVYRSFEIRLNVEWPRAINALMKDPLLGTGYSSIGLASDNDILRSLGEVGLLGTWAFVLILVIVFKRLWANFRQPTRFIKFLAAGTIAVLAAFLVNSLFIDVFEASKIAFLFWVMMGVGIAAAQES